MAHKIKYQVTQTESKTKLAKFFDWFKRKPKAADVPPVVLLSWTKIDDETPPPSVNFISTESFMDSPLVTDELVTAAGGEGEEKGDPQTDKKTTAEAAAFTEKKRTALQKFRRLCCCCCSQTDDDDDQAPAPVDLISPSPPEPFTDGKNEPSPSKSSTKGKVINTIPDLKTGFNSRIEDEALPVSLAIEGEGFTHSNESVDVINPLPVSAEDSDEVDVANEGPAIRFDYTNKI